jgi:hypothetical protein
MGVMFKLDRRVRHFSSSWGGQPASTIIQALNVTAEGKGGDDARSMFSQSSQDIPRVDLTRAKEGS